MRKLLTITAVSIGFVGVASSGALACDDWDGYRTTRGYGYSYAPRTYGYYAPAYAASWDDDDYGYYGDDYAYGYGYGGLAVGIGIARDRRHYRNWGDGGRRNVAFRNGSAMRGAAFGGGGRGFGGGMGGRGGGGRR